MWIFFRFRLKKSNQKSSSNEKFSTLEKDLLKRDAQLHEIEQTLPKQNSIYLQIILGNVNVSILNKNDKYVHFFYIFIRYNLWPSYFFICEYYQITCISILSLY